MTVALPPFGRNFDGTLTVQILGSQRMRLQHLLRSTGKYDFTTQSARFWTHIDDIIGCEHHVFIMFHHDNGITHVAQFFQRMDKPLVIPLVQSDARLVQDVEHIYQLRTYLRSQSNALAFTTGKADSAAV